MAYLTSGRDKIMGSSVSTDANVVTVIDATSTDEQVPSALATKAYVDSKYDLVESYSKDEVDNLLNDKANTSDIIDAYTKDEVNNLLDAKADTNDIIDSYTKDEVNDLLDTKVNVDDLVESYSKDETDTLLADKANTSDTYNKTEIDALLDGKANTDDVTTNGYTKEEVDDLLANKADSSSIVDAYTKGEVDNLLNAKADTSALDNYVLSDELDDYALTSSVYNKTEVDDLLADKANATDIVDAYTKDEVDNLLTNKANTSDIIDSYTKDEVNTLLDDKANSTDIVDAYTKTEVDDLLTAKVNISSVVLTLSSANTDEEIPSAKAVYTYVDNKEVKISTEENNKIEIKDDGIFVSKDYVEITQAEYDLLTEEEKEDIVFYITDATGNTELVTVIDENSTDEQVPSAKAVHTAIQNVSVGVPADVYSKTEVDDLLADKADSADIIDSYTKEEVDNLLNAKVDTDDVVDAYSKEEVNNLLDAKADTSDIIDAYTKGEVDNLLNAKADTSAIVDAYTKTEVDGLLANKANTSAIIDAYTKDETNDLLDAKVNTDDLVDAYSKTEVDGLLNAKVNTSDVVTALSSSSTDEEIPSAKVVHTAIQEAKTELENEITNIPKVTKTSELTNDSGFITANDIPDVDLEPYALKTQIPTTLPASDVYDWAKEATKPTYTASEVGALASDGTAVNASKVEKALTLRIAGTTKNTYDGSTAQFFNIPNASTSESGVMTSAMVTKLNGIATGANLIKTSQNNASVTTSSGFSPTISTCVIGNNTVGSVWIITGMISYNVSSAPSADSSMFSINQQITQYKEETIYCPCMTKENAYITVSVKNGTFYYKSYTGTAPTSNSRYFISAVIPVSSNSFVS